MVNILQKNKLALSELQIESCNSTFLKLYNK